MHGPALSTVHALAPQVCPNKNADKLKTCRRLNEVGWLMGLEPTTTRITIWDSTN